MLAASRPPAVAIAFILLLAGPAAAFNFPLSDEAIREAYFVGQRRDESMAQFLARYKSLLAQVAGVVIIVFGLHLTGIFKIKALYMDARLHQVKGGSTPWGAFVIGFAFAFGWTPCVGPILAVILGLAATQDSVAKGIFLLAIYSMGLAVPFLLTSLGIERFLKFYSRFRSHMHAVEVASGALLIVLGGLLVLGRFTIISGYFSFLNRFAL